MKRFSAIRELTKVLNESDVAIFSGADMCKEAYQYDKPGYFYIEDSFGIATSFGLGVALSTDKRVFVFVGEGDLLRDLTAVGQAGASKCKNLFIVVLDNGGYQHAGNFPNIFDSFLSKKGVFYNIGCLVHDFTVNIKNRYLVEVRAAVERIRGPMVILVEVDRGLKKGLADIKSKPTSRTKALIKFVRDNNLGSALYVPPVWLAGPGAETKSVNIGKISGGIN
jgi:hypothetical protein